MTISERAAIRAERDEMLQKSELRRDIDRYDDWIETADQNAVAAIPGEVWDAIDNFLGHAVAELYRRAKSSGINHTDCPECLGTSTRFRVGNAWHGCPTCGHGE